MRGNGSIGLSRPHEAGLTLIEMLIVLVIIGVAAGATTLAIGAVTRPPSVEAEARRLATRLQGAADNAMLGDQMVAFTVRKHGYGFADVRQGAMVPRTDDALGYHELPSGMVMTLDVTPPVVLGVDGVGQPIHAVIESGKQRWEVVYDGMTAVAAPAPVVAR
jgi:general secretion pathway protein H